MIDLSKKKSDRNSVYKLIDGWDAEAISQAKVMVVGAGALGNEVLKNLALLSVGHILIVDFDIIEESNLSRSVLFRKSDSDKRRYKSEVAKERIKEINKGVKVMNIHGDILVNVGLGVFRQMDVIIGCLDNRLARLALNQLCFRVGKTWIDGGLSDFSGQMVVYRSDKACYECNLSPVEKEMIAERHSCPDIAKRYASMGRVATTPITASLIAALQTQEAVKVIHGNEQHLMAGQKFYFIGSCNEVGISTLPVPHENGCLSNFHYKHIIEAKELSHQSTLEEVLNWAKQYFKDADPDIQLDYPLVREIKSEKTGKTVQLDLLKPLCSDEILDPFRADYSDRIQFSKQSNEIGFNFDKLDLTLESIGIPALHILRIMTSDGKEYFVELTKDEHFLQFE